ncbi:hypothetical protein A2955_02800 [Candidatus Woesebacteria bacterium RIFCSPLOWO2_01_FULL_37_19]|uniref:2'-deoxynucleoside 5'-phosphate N-hydrolase 1 n=2 Tax=Candidatus Woeseibacteriota TaxID=1752722 RepID=A0A1F8BAR3_9BACT|nr:MAG: hypothetical protein A2771_00205 [Candidatus Woesebacteria bacterium RIFCSPHIGHO2_01_FULL_38_26b]OGM61103.1 MAG: hypothetical protein A2955_02800 [Candidatus Woesebacteria bacterium RIFCSPLOWO2_01_FULL_37_19]
MKVYLAGSMSAGRQFAQGLQAINDALINMGNEILTPFVVDEELNKHRFPELSGVEHARAIFEDDLRRIEESDIIIAEVSQPSTGVGLEIGFVVGSLRSRDTEKSILLLRHRSLEATRNSKLVEGNIHAKFLYYDSENIEGILNSFFSEIQESKIRRERE